MAVNTSIKVATLSNAAKDDSFSFGEDSFNANLDVLSNDAGAAKLYSLAQVSGTTATQLPKP